MRFVWKCQLIFTWPAHQMGSYVKCQPYLIRNSFVFKEFSIIKNQKIFLNNWKNIFFSLKLILMVCNFNKKKLKACQQNNNSKVYKNGMYIMLGLQRLCWWNIDLNKTTNIVDLYESAVNWLICRRICFSTLLKLRYNSSHTIKLNHFVDFFYCYIRTKFNEFALLIY